LNSVLEGQHSASDASNHKEAATIGALFYLLKTGGNGVSVRTTFLVICAMPK